VTDHVIRELRRSFMRSAYRRRHEFVSPMGHVVGFWILLGGAACLFAASVFLPLWQEQQEVMAAKTQTERRLDGLRAELAQLEVIAQALSEDPILNEHAALRELNYHIPGQEIIVTQPEECVETASGVSQSGMGSGRLRYVPQRWLQFETWVDWVCDRSVRRGMLLAAAVLASAAFVLFAPPSPRNPGVLIARSRQ